MKRFCLVLVFALLVMVSASCLDDEVTPPPSPLPTVSPLELPPAQNRAEGGPIETMEVTMSDLQTLLVAAAFLSLVANRLVEGLVTPAFDKFKLDKFWLMYISWAVGGVLVVVSGVNLFTAIPGVAMPAVVGLVLSGLVAGGGSNLLNELFDWLGQGKRKGS